MLSRPNKGLPKSLGDALLFSVAVHALLLFAGLSWFDRPFALGSGVAIDKLQVCSIGVAKEKPSSAEPTRRNAFSARPKRIVNTMPAGNSPADAPPRAPDNGAASILSPLLSPATGIVARSGDGIGSAGSASNVSTSAAVIANRATDASDGAADELRGYRIALAAQARRFRTYPAIAQERNLAGRVDVEVVLLPFGQTDFQLKKSSGHDILDQVALDMLRRAALSVDVPAAIKGRNFSFVLPVEFIPPP